MAEKAKRPRGQPPRVFTEKERDQVKALAAMGMPIKNICRIIGTDNETLSKHCKKELESGDDKGLAMALNSRYVQMNQGNMAAIKHYLATRHGICERTIVENTGENGGPLIVKWMD